jgi:hypothetical protein
VKRCLKRATFMLAPIDTRGPAMDGASTRYRPRWASRWTSHGPPTQVIGRIEAARYLSRVMEQVPYGRSSRLRHVVGSTRGGGFEWTAGPGAETLAGISALELDADGLLTRITSATTRGSWSRVAGPRSSTPRSRRSQERANDATTSPSPS